MAYHGLLPALLHHGLGRIEGRPLQRPISSLSTPSSKAAGSSSSVLHRVFPFFLFLLFLLALPLFAWAPSQRLCLGVSPCGCLCFGAAEASVLAPPLVEQTSLITILGTSGAVVGSIPRQRVPLRLQLVDQVLDFLGISPGRPMRRPSPQPHGLRLPATDSGTPRNLPPGSTPRRAPPAPTEASAPPDVPGHGQRLNHQALQAGRHRKSRPPQRERGRLDPHPAMHSKLGIE